MQAYSIPIILVLVLVYLLYWIKSFSKPKIQNLLLLMASYICYAFWDWKFLILIIGIASINFFAGKAISLAASDSKKRLILVLNIILHIGILGVFRYYNYLVDDLTKLLSIFGKPPSWNSLNIIIPLGISIYMLQAISYTFDIFKKKIEPTRDIVAFLAFVSFFPQMIAGPVERASTFLPQFFKERQFSLDDLRSGGKRIIWGLFKKLVIANSLAVYANEIFANYSDYSGITIFAGLVCFAFQFYADISAFTDIAIGIAKLFGLTLNQNFRIPYFAKNLNDFWSRWNISVMFWIKDYVYNPLGGADRKPVIVFRNLFLLFLLVGLWHGGNMSFILFALVNAILLLPSTLRPELVLGNYNNKIKILNSVEALTYFILTGLFIIIGLTFFRAVSFHDSVQILRNLFTNLFSISMNELRSLGNGFTASLTSVIMLTLYIIIEWLQRKSEFALDFTNSRVSPGTGRLITIFVLILLMFFHQSGQDFVYLKF